MLPQKHEKMIVGILLVLVMILAGALGFALMQNMQLSQNTALSQPLKYGGMVACPMDAKTCPDGSTVSRSGPNCEFEKCSVSSNIVDLVSSVEKFCREHNFSCPAITIVDQKYEYAVAESGNSSSMKFFLIFVEGSWETLFGTTENNICDTGIGSIDLQKYCASSQGLNKNQVCPEIYSPVCAQPPMPQCPEGLACAQVMPEANTFSNSCKAEVAGAEILYQGECEKNNRSKRPFLTEDLYQKLNLDDAEIRCAQVFNVDAANQFTLYKSPNGQFTFEVPYNENWGTNDYRVKPFVETAEQDIWFGSADLFEGCGTVRRYRLQILPKKSLDQIHAEVEAGDFSKITQRKKIINKLETVQYISGGICDVPTIEVIGQKNNYKFSQLCGDESDIETLESIVRSFQEL